ncbi:aminotransferase class IV [Chenggangzhangella methanolivorans]|uniref:Probable branched-chain-amino-acid aminotransferase n=1 Tax=Chenggangzhangella methanolivorans TaxID=1437009 RepID=A0A9E6R8G9_9HYPH|nr:aminotransferase class IV [Chenggangzhangella methanolivorans]QZN98763.1 aminotransferase class IV [Chenggangzhangella methanolivorans]
MLRLNGAPVEGPALFDLGDRGLTLGDGLFETIAVFGGRPAALGQHWRRLETAAAEIRLPVDRALFVAEIEALLNAIGRSDAVIRYTVTRGGGARGLAPPADPRPNVVAAASPYPADALYAPVRLATSSVRRNPTSFASRAKTLSYLDSVLAFAEARRAGADDALMLNTDGRVASTAMANLFAVVEGELVTPPVSEGVLPGIVRGVVLSEDFGAVERPLSQDELAGASAVFSTNSVRLVMPVIELDGRPMPDHPIFGMVAAAVARICGAPQPD